MIADGLAFDRVTLAERGWSRTAIPLAIVLTGIIGLYWPTAVSLVKIWASSETYAHGFVVPVIAAWLVWRQRGEWLPVAPRPAWAAVPPLAFGSLAWLAGQLAEANALAQAAFVIALILAVSAVVGYRVARINTFALGFLLFAVPVGEVFIPQLMEWTADFAVTGLRASGVPVYREGLRFVIPSGDWSVVEACSGVRYLIASLTVGTLFAYLTYRSWPRRLGFMAIAVAVPVVANWVRAYLIVMLGHLSGNRLAVGVDHLIYGWIFFGLVILLMFWIGVRWREDLPAPAVREPWTPAPVAAPRAVWGVVPVVVAVMAAAGLGPGLYLAMGAGDHSAETPIRLELPPTIAEWQADPSAQADWKPHFESPTMEIQQLYSGSRGRVGVYVAYYRSQRPDRKLISSVNVLVTSDDRTWHRLARGTQELDLGGEAVALSEEVLRGPQQSKLTAWYGFRIDGHWTSSPTRAKLLTAWARLGGRGDGSAAVVIYTVGDSNANDPALLRRFSDAALPLIASGLDRAGLQP